MNKREYISQMESFHETLIYTDTEMGSFQDEVDVVVVSHCKHCAKECRQTAIPLAMGVALVHHFTVANEKNCLSNINNDC
jgi:hypothetical protein